MVLLASSKKELRVIEIAISWAFYWGFPSFWERAADHLVIASFSLLRFVI
jgi:hypothetical protein